MDKSSTVTRGEGWLSAWVGQEHVMMSADTGTCISLSETGGRIWELIERPASLAQIFETLSAEYDVEPAALQQDVVTFLESMQEQKAIEVR